MKKVVYVGIFGGVNIGDLVISNQIHNYFVNENFSVDLIDFISLKKVKTSTTQISIQRKVPTHSKIKTIFLSNNLTANFYSQNEVAISKLYSIYKEITANYVDIAYKEYIKCIEECDFVCIGGGNLLMTLGNDLWAIKMKKLISIAKKKGKKVFICSVGAGPILSKRAQIYFADAMNMADYITVRDEKSKKLLKNELNVKKNIDVSGDPALLLNNVRAKSLDDNKVNIAVSIMPFGKKGFFNLDWYENEKYYIETFQDLIFYLHNKNNNFVFSLFSSTLSDYEMIKELESTFEQKNTDKAKVEIKTINLNNLDELLEFYGEQDILIGTRMHSLIIAYTQLIPIIAISWQDKIMGLMNYLKLSEYCYDLNSVNKSYEQIYNDVNRLLNEGEKNDSDLCATKEKFVNVTNNILDDLKQHI